MADQEIILKARLEAEQFRRQLKALQKDVKAPLSAVVMAQEAVYRSSEKINKALGKSQFQGWALSIMFFGMALKQMFNTVWQFGTKTFNDIRHSVEGTTTEFDALNNSVTYLGFVVGQALEPVAAFLAPIIMWIADWISNNQTLFTTIVVIAGILGTVLTVVGALVLGVAGFITAWGIAGGAITAALGAIGAAFLPILAVMAAVAVLIVMWKTDFAGFKDFIISAFTGVWEFLKSIWVNIAGIFTGFFKLLKGIFTGDFELIWEGARDIVLNVLSLLVKAFFNVGAVLLNVFIFAWNAIITLTMNQITIMLGLFKKLADMLGLEGFSSKISGAIDIYKNIKEKASLDYISGDTMSKYFAGTDELLGLTPSTTNNTTTTNNVFNFNGLTTEELLSQVQSRVS